MSGVVPLPERRQRPRTPWQVQRSVLMALLIREIRVRVGGQWTGAIWTLLEPMAHVLMLMVVFTAIRGITHPGIETPVFLIAGLVPFFFFQKTVTRMLDGIDANRGLFAYRQVQPIDALLARAAVEALMNIVVYVFSLGMLGWLGYHVLPARPLEMLTVNVLTGLLGCAFGLLLAVFTHGRPRLRTFVRLGFLPLYFVSGVIFDVSRLPREWAQWLMWNPLLHLVDLSRQSFSASYVGLPGVGLEVPLAFLLVATALALALYRTSRERLLTLG